MKWPSQEISRAKMQNTDKTEIEKSQELVLDKISKVSSSLRYCSKKKTQILM